MIDWTSKLKITAPEGSVLRVWRAEQALDNPACELVWPPSARENLFLTQT